MKKTVVIILFLIITIGLLLLLRHNNNKYDRLESEQIERFLNQRSEDEKKTNGQVLKYYNSLPLFWGGIITREYNNKYLIKSISFFDKHYNRTARLKGTLMLSDLKELKNLNISENLIDTLIVENCVNLTNIDCYKNNIKKIMLVGCSNLSILILSYNPIEELDVSDCPNLETLEIYGCSLKKIVVSKNQAWQTWGIDTTLVKVYK